VHRVIPAPRADVTQTDRSSHSQSTSMLKGALFIMIVSAVFDTLPPSFQRAVHVANRSSSSGIKGHSHRVSNSAASILASHAAINFGSVRSDRSDRS
jgi:hypothetical protein